MNLSTITNKTMSSREIAQLCDKRHDNVLRDIENLNGTYRSMGFLEIEEGLYTHPQVQNQKFREFLLTQELTLDLITGYRADLRIKINRRWAELEKQSNLPALPQSFSQALRLAAQQAEQIEQQQAKLALTEPKAKALDIIDSSMGSLGVRETAKTIGIAQNKFVEWCIEHDWMYRDTKQKLVPFSMRLKQGYMEQRAVTYSATYYESKTTVQPMFTSKGLARLAKIFSIVHEVSVC